jgi:hypothetical protein
VILVLAVVFDMMPAGFDVMVFSVAGVTKRSMGMVRRFFVVASFMMLGGFAMMLGRVLVMFGGLVVVIDARMVAHH